VGVASTLPDIVKVARKGASVPNDAPIPSTPETPAPDAAAPPDNRPVWTRPEIVSFAPIADARGSADQPGDGISNAVS
jgi:hypothetical protein